MGTTISVPQLLQQPMGKGRWQGAAIHIESEQRIGGANLLAAEALKATALQDLLAADQPRERSRCSESWRERWRCCANKQLAVVEIISLHCSHPLALPHVKLGVVGFAVDRLARPSGEVVEWLMAPVLKTGVPKGTVGSNPTLSVFRVSNGNLENPTAPAAVGYLP
jgi:hypothetical protein